MLLASTDLPSQTDENSDNFKYEPHAKSWAYISFQNTHALYWIVSDLSEDEREKYSSVCEILRQNKNNDDSTVKTYNKTILEELKASEKRFTQAAEKQDDVSYSTVKRHVDLIIMLGSLPKQKGKQKSIGNVKKALELFKRLKEPTDLISLKLYRVLSILTIDFQLNHADESNFELLAEVTRKNNELFKVLYENPERLERCCKWMGFSSIDVNFDKILHRRIDVLVTYFTFMHNKITNTKYITELVMDHLTLLYEPGLFRAYLPFVYWALEIAHLSIQRRAFPQADYTLYLVRKVSPDIRTACKAETIAAKIRLNVQWMQQFVAEKITGTPEKTWSKDIIEIGDANISALVLSEIRTKPIANTNEFMSLFNETVSLYRFFLVDDDYSSCLKNSMAYMEKATNLARFLLATKRSYVEFMLQSEFL